MKKLIFLLMAVLALSAARSQSVTTLTWSGYGNTLDTVTNTGTKYAGFTNSRPASAVSIFLKVTKISGTVGGTISWQGSHDGTNYVSISTTSASDATANYQYNVVGQPPFKYYRASWTGTGTMSASVSGSYIIWR